MERRWGYVEVFSWKQQSRSQGRKREGKSAVRGKSVTGERIHGMGD
jgi:hypothetical protein